MKKTLRKPRGRRLARGAGMGKQTRILVATRSPTVRATVAEWLHSGDFHAVPIPNVGASAAEIESLKFEALILDAELMSTGSLMRAARYRATPRPVIVLGDADPAAELEVSRCGASYLVRPIQRERLLFAITLALAEERPHQKFPRKLVPRFPGLVDGLPVNLLDVSYEGVRFEIADRYSGSLRPCFTLRVPLFNVTVMVQRVWVSTAIDAASQLWCGGMVARNQRAARSWRMLVDMTPDASAPTGGVALARS